MPYPCRNISADLQSTNFTASAKGDASKPLLLVSWSFVSNIGVKDEGDTGGNWGRSVPKACQALAEAVWEGKIRVSW